MKKSNKHGEEKCENALEMAVYDLLTIGEENEIICFFSYNILVYIESTASSQ